MTDLKRAVAELRKGGSLTLSSVADGFDAFCTADLTRALARDAEDRSVVFVHVARDEVRARAFVETLAFAAPEIEVIELPAWDCQPYDRASPNASISARRDRNALRRARPNSHGQCQATSSYCLRRIARIFITYYLLSRY